MGCRFTRYAIHHHCSSISCDVASTTGFPAYSVSLFLRPHGWCARPRLPSGRPRQQRGASAHPPLCTTRSYIAAPVPAQSIAASRRTAITTAVERVAPAVVTVQTETVERVPADFFEYFSGGRSGERRSAGIGSGFIIRADGVIVTNAHVIGGASKVSVALRDGTTYDAKIIGIDDNNDLAVVKITAPKLPVAPLGTSADLVVGEWSIAIGNPFGFVLGNSEPSVSVGVISAVGRNLAGRGDGGGVYVDMVQTDAAINRGILVAH